MVVVGVEEKVTDNVWMQVRVKNIFLPALDAARADGP